MSHTGLPGTGQQLAPKQLHKTKNIERRLQLELLVQTKKKGGGGAFPEEEDWKEMQTETLPTPAASSF